MTQTRCLRHTSSSRTFISETPTNIIKFALGNDAFNQAEARMTHQKHEDGTKQQKPANYLQIFAAMPNQLGDWTIDWTIAAQILDIRYMQSSESLYLSNSTFLFAEILQMALYNHRIWYHQDFNNNALNGDGLLTDLSFNFLNWLCYPQIGNQFGFRTIWMWSNSCVCLWYVKNFCDICLAHYNAT